MHYSAENLHGENTGHCDMKWPHDNYNVAHLYHTWQGNVLRGETQSK